MRRLHAGDLAEYKALRDRMLAAHPGAYTSDAEEARIRPPASYLDRLGDGTDPALHTLGAHLGGRLVGAISCERGTRIKVRHVGHLIGMMVLDDCQGRGIGRALLDASLALARQAPGLEMLTLTVSADNRAAVALYERAGFVRCGTLPRAIKVGDRYHDKDEMVLAW